MKLRVQGSPGFTSASKSLTVSPPQAANKDIDGSRKSVVADKETVTVK